jgi:hypothetical protein
MADLAAKLEPIARAMLDDGETLVGCCIATWQKTFSGGMVAVAVAPGRIVLQRLDRRFAPAGDPISLPPDQVEAASIAAGVGRSVSIPSILMENVSITVELATTGAGRIRMMLVGSGGEVQHAGIQELVAYLDRIG